MDKIEKHGNIRDYWLETPDNENIGAIMANELGPMKDILIQSYGENWRNEASEEVLGQLLHNV